VKVRRILVFLAALLAFIASAPSAPASGFDVASLSDGVSGLPKPDTKPERHVAPELHALTVLHGTSAVSPGNGRRFSDTGDRILALAARDPRTGSPGVVARIDAEADARRRRASNTSCCVRGPPTAV
jgi:hypothetical protein